MISNSNDSENRAEPPTASPSPNASASPASSAAPELAWDYAIPVATNRFIVWDMVRVFALSMLILQALLAGMGWFLDGEPLLLPLSFWGLLSGILVVLFALSALVMQNRVDARFTLDAEGATVEAAPRVRRLNRAAFWLGMAMGKPGLIGAGLLAGSQETTRVAWTDVSKVRIHPRERVIDLGNGRRTLVRLYCPPGDFAAAAALVQRHAARAGTSSA